MYIHVEVPVYNVHVQVYMQVQCTVGKITCIYLGKRFLLTHPKAIHIQDSIISTWNVNIHVCTNVHVYVCLYTGTP